MRTHKWEKGLYKFVMCANIEWSEGGKNSSSDPPHILNLFCRAASLFTFYTCRRSISSKTATMGRMSRTFERPSRAIVLTRSFVWSQTGSNISQYQSMTFTIHNSLLRTWFRRSKSAHKFPYPTNPRLKFWNDSRLRDFIWILFE